MLALKDFVEMENIEKQFFDVVDIMPAKESYDLYLKDPSHICVVRHGERVVGFVLALSLNADTFERVKTGETNEVAIKPCDLEIGAVAYENIYLSSIAVDKNFQNAATLLKLLNEFKKHMREIVDTHAVRQVITEPITPEGRKIATHFFKMKPVKSNPKIYFCTGAVFQKCVKFGSKNQWKSAT